MASNGDLITAFIDAWQTKDVDAILDFFTEDAVYLDPAWGRQEGRETIRQFFVQSMSWRPPPEFNMPPPKPEWSTHLPQAWRHLPDVFSDTGAGQ